MEQRGEYVIPAPQQDVWDTLQQADALKECIDGCESMTQTGDSTYVATVRAKLGPLRARFTVNIEMVDRDEPTSYALEVQATGGAAGFGKGRAEVELVPDDDSTLLRYVAQGTVGGKVSQIGARLIHAATRKVADNFFSAFVQRWTVDA